MKAALLPARFRGFTLVEMLVVITIIAMLAALTMGGYTYAMRGSREKTTRGTFEAVQTALETYNTEFGEFPEPAGTDQMVEFIPGKSYDVSGAACLYQALSGDGYDQIKGVTADSNEGATATSDGKTEGDGEVKNVTMREMPQSMYMNKNGVYVLIDGFARPFQYIKAVPPTTGGEDTDPVTINTTYDLWSYNYDDVNTTKKSIEAVEDPRMALKWIKNW
jgi:prepilin-type N-terminal cleavage/methylation domain-containing protein